MFDLPAAQALFDKEGRYDEILVGGDDGARRSLSAALPGLNVQTAEKHDRFTLDGLKDFVGFLKVFLLVFGGIAVFVGAFTIFNTLSITVAQRTRELGMLRAVGMTRRQVRRMVRHESVVTALIGAVLGIAIGLFLAALATTALSGEGLRFAVPVGSLIVFTIVAVVAGVLAAIGPARRASRLDVLKALQYE